MLKAIARRNVSHYRGEFLDIAGLCVRGGLKEGPRIGEFEAEFARYIGARYAVAVGSGRLGLYLILASLGLDEGAQIVLPAYTHASVPALVIEAGYTPVFVDIDPDTHNIDTSLIADKITAKTRVIIATHLFGRPCDMKKIAEIAKKYNLVVIEDCAQAIGVEYNSQKVGMFGAAAYFSFGMTKPFNTFGGGMVVTNDAALYAKIKTKTRDLPCPGALHILKNIAFSYALLFLTSPAVFSLAVFPLLLLLAAFGRDVGGVYDRTTKKTVPLGRIKVKYSNVQAMVGLRHLENLPAANEGRLRNAGLLVQGLSKENGIRLLRDGPETRSIYSFFVVVTQDMKRVSRKLLARGVDTGKYLMHDCSALYAPGQSCPVTREALRGSLQIPLYPELRVSDIRYMTGVINRATKRGSPRS